MLSVVIASRNDDHGGQMIARTNTFIRALAYQAHAHEVPVELILVEWNPPPDAPSLTTALEWPRADAYFCARVIVVPPEVHGLMGNSDKLDFYQMIAKNVGIRRARYPWVLATNPDLLFPDEIFNALKGPLDPACFYRAIRTDVGLRTLDDALSVPEQITVCRENVARVHDGTGGHLHTYACGDFTLMAKSAWERLRGYPEFDLWSIHVDSVFLFWADANGYAERMIPEGECYHLEHEGAWVTDPGFGAAFPKLSSADVGDMAKQMKEGTFEHNGPTWGLAGVPLPDYAISGGQTVRYADLTLFAIPKGMDSPVGQIQRNAIGSWIRLRPRPHVVLIGDMPGVAEYARRFRLEHRPEVTVNAFGTPTLDGVLAIAQSAATTHMALVNSDIILLPDFVDAFQALVERLGTFLMIGRRTCCKIEGALSFSEKTWRADLRALAAAEGRLDAAGALDYFVFQRGAYAEVPPFAIGRTAWDNWLATNADAFRVDATHAVLAIDQEHGGMHGVAGDLPKAAVFDGPEARENRRLAQGYKLGSTNHAQATLTADLLLIPKKRVKLPDPPSAPLPQHTAPSAPAPTPGSKTRRGYTRPPPKDRKPVERPRLKTSYRPKKDTKPPHDSGVGGMRAI